MNTVETSLVCLFLLETVVLVVSSVVIGWVGAAQGWAVVYQRGVRMLVGALLFLTASAVMDAAVKAGVDGRLLQYLAQAGFTVASVAILAAAWYFARDFVSADETEPPSVGAVSGDRGGFEDA